MKPHTAARGAAIVFTMAALQLVSANESFQVDVTTTSEHALGSEACAQAFMAGKQDAIGQLEQHYQAKIGANFVVNLVDSEETRTPLDDQKTACTISAQWEGRPLASAENLIGSEQAINGKYEGNCLDSGNGDICWQRIVRQAREDLYHQLQREYDDMRGLELVYLDFEGRQRDQYRQGRLEMSADGTFYFEVIKPYASRSDTRPAPEPAPTYAESEHESEPTQEHSKANEDNLDVTLFYTWDGNDSAELDQLAISSNRWGLGVWAHNRLGFAAFWGEDEVGLGDSDDTVKNANLKYDTFGVGMGFRLGDDSGLVMENLLYYVDAKPFQANIAPNCKACSARDFQADDYLQASMNFKTNSNGFNLGWIFTYKFLPEEPNLNNLSSGLYIELQL